MKKFAIINIKTFQQVESYNHNNIENLSRAELEKVLAEIKTRHGSSFEILEIA